MRVKVGDIHLRIEKLNRDRTRLDVCVVCVWGRVGVYSTTWTFRTIKIEFSLVRTLTTLYVRSEGYGLLLG